MSEEEFWGLTLAQITSLTKRHTLEQESLNYRAAIVSAIIAETHRDHKKRTKPFTPADFMPKMAKRKISGKEIADRIVAMNTILGGETV